MVTTPFETALWFAFEGEGTDKIVTSREALSESSVCGV